MHNTISRRRFVLSGAAVTVAATLPGSALASRAGDEVFTNASVGIYAQGLLTAQHCKGLIGTLFMAFLEKQHVAYLRLQTVTTVEIKSKRVSYEAFHLSFSTGGVVLDQDSYLLDHGTLGRFALFVVPGLDAHGAPTCGAVIVRPSQSHA